MGLFGFGKKKKKWEQIKAERIAYLESCPESKMPLWSGPPELAIEFVRKKIMHPKWNFPNLEINYDWWEINRDWAKYYQYTNHYYLGKRGEGTSILTASEFLMGASECGSGDAAFLLGVMHEHGMEDFNPDNGEQYNWYEIAKGRECRLMQALELLKKDMVSWRNAGNSQDEFLAINMWYVSCKAGFLPEVEKLLTDEDLSLLNWISCLLLCHYCGHEYPFSMLIIVKMLCNQDLLEKNGTMVDNFFKYDNHAKYIDWNGLFSGAASNEKIKKCGNEILELFVEMKEKGNSFCDGALYLTSQW